MSKNCGLFSEESILPVASGSEPSQPPSAPTVQSYDSSSAMTVAWDAPEYDGGFAVTSQKLYVDNMVLVELNPTLN